MNAPIPLRDRVWRAAFRAAGAVVIVATVALLSFLSVSGVRGAMGAGWTQLLFGTVWKPEDRAFGGLPLIVGTLSTACGGVVAGAVPGLLSALYMQELATQPLRTTFRRVMEVASAVPSVVYRWLALRFLVPEVTAVARRSYGVDAPVTGEGVASAALLLGVMIAPTVCILASDSFSLVPRPYREASTALGATDLQTAFRVTLPSAWRGLIVAVFFGFARAAGETMAVQMVIGGARQLPSHPFMPTTTLSTQIFMDMQNARPGTLESDVLYFMALLLLGLSAIVVLGTGRLGRPRP